MSFSNDLKNNTNNSYQSCKVILVLYTSKEDKLSQRYKKLCKNLLEEKIEYVEINNENIKLAVSSLLSKILSSKFDINS